MKVKWWFFLESEKGESLVVFFCKDHMLLMWWCCLAWLCIITPKILSKKPGQKGQTMTQRRILEAAAEMQLWGNIFQLASFQVGMVYSSQKLNLESQRSLSLWDSGKSWYNYCKGNRFYKFLELKNFFLLAMKREVLRLRGIKWPALTYFKG